MLLITAVRRLIVAETARYLCPRSEHACQTYAVAWFAAVKANGGCSRRLSRISHEGALSRIRQMTVGLTMVAAANDNAFPVDPELLQKCDNDRAEAIEHMDCEVEPPHEWLSPVEVSR